MNRIFSPARAIITTITAICIFRCQPLEFLWTAGVLENNQSSNICHFWIPDEIPTTIQRFTQIIHLSWFVNCRKFWTIFMTTCITEHRVFETVLYPHSYKTSRYCMVSIETPWIRNKITRSKRLLYFSTDVIFHMLQIVCVYNISERWNAVPWHRSNHALTDYASATFMRCVRWPINTDSTRMWLYSQHLEIWLR